VPPPVVPLVPPPALQLSAPTPVPLIRSSSIVTLLVSRSVIVVSEADAPAASALLMLIVYCT
jgi:hypothetical protein